MPASLVTTASFQFKRSAINTPPDQMTSDAAPSVRDPRRSSASSAGGAGVAKEVASPRQPTDASLHSGLPRGRSMRSVALHSCVSGQVDDEASEHDGLLGGRVAVVVDGVRPAADWAAQQAGRQEELLRESSPPGVVSDSAAGVPLYFDALSAWRRGTPLRLLNGVCGVARPGELTAVIGSDDGAVDALMSIISGSVPASAYQGDVWAGGVLSQGPGSVYHALVGHVVRHPVFLSRELTVRRTLQFTSRLVVADRERSAAAVSRVMGLCGLTDYSERRANTLETDAFKRLAIALELLTDPKVLIVEDPTRYLGVAASLDMIRLLHSIASKLDKTVIISLHQPRWAVYSEVDSLLLLHGMHLAYLGRAGEHPVRFFQDNSLSWDASDSPTDFLLKLAVRSTDQDREARGGAQRATSFEDGPVAGPAVPAGVWAVFESSPQYRTQLRPTLDMLLKHAAFPQAEVPDNKPGECSRFIVLMRVVSLQNMAQWKWNVLRCAVVVISGTLAGKLYESQEVSLRGMQNRVGICFFILIVLMLANLPFASGLIHHRPVFHKHRAGGYYHVWTYWMVLVAWELLFVRGLLTLGFSMIVFYLTGFDSTSDVGSFVGIVTVIQMTFAAMVTAAGAWAASENAAMLILLSLCSFFTLSSGLIVNSTSIPEWIVWVERLSILRYGFESILTDLFEGNFNGEHGVRDGDEYLELLGFKTRNKWRNMYILMGMWCGLLVLALLGFARQQRVTIASRPKFRGRPFLAKTSSSKTSRAQTLHPRF
eukprot:TRINITY_DN11800_c0_g5_i1.p1 TRINITY_DN11800_c0_g5~~TRINITY_DN11800_c0_g5_i1.p1  ORF type:complete len:768 (+),score=195.67 TRINITY_DN11800_c0_g5_i1:58-2361(+)